jgi:pimeloyl-ACP methyl ester carboxylesterase
MESSARPTFLLVHGAWEDASIWSGVVAELERRGRRAFAVSLPGRGPGAKPSEVTLDMLRDAALAAVRAEAQPVILVGHSFGGITISNVAEAAPERIRLLVYLAAYLPQSGQSLQALAFSDADSKAGPAFQVDESRMTASIRQDARADLFLNDGDATTRDGFASTMVDEPLAPLATPVTLTADRFGRVPRVYIHTARDQVVSPALQARMVAASPVLRSATIDAGHAPFLTRPAELAGLLVQISAD